MSKYRLINECGPRNVRLNLRQLNASEVEADYLPLRYATLHCELKWTNRPTTLPSELRDAYDESALKYGIYRETTILAAIRLIIADRTDRLPSGAYFPHPFQTSGRLAEVSKAMVCPLARKLGLFTALLLECEIQALKNEVNRLFISVIDTDRVRRLLREEGFQVFGLPFYFDDQKISPKDSAVLFFKQVYTDEQLIQSLVKRQESILSHAQSILNSKVEFSAE